MTNDLTTWVADPTRQASTAASSDASAPTPIAAIAGGSCRPAGTADGDTVATPVSNVQHASDAPSVSLGTAADTVAIRLPIPNVSLDCEQCGVAFVARRPWARFCSAYCRRLAWLERNPERAAELAERDRARLHQHVIGNGKDV